MLRCAGEEVDLPALNGQSLGLQRPGWRRLRSHQGTPVQPQARAEGMPGGGTGISLKQKRRRPVIRNPKTAVEKAMQTRHPPEGHRAGRHTGRHGGHEAAAQVWAEGTSGVQRPRRMMPQQRTIAELTSTA
jgi:hypothetical protein